MRRVRACLGYTTSGGTKKVPIQLGIVSINMVLTKLYLQTQADGLWP